MQFKNDEIIKAGESNQDFIIQLFQVYKTCPVPQFRHAMDIEYNKYIDGAKMTPTQLMTTALLRYNANKDHWKTEDPKLIALTTVVEKLQAMAKTTVRPLDPPNREKKDAWKLIGPEEGKPKSKVVNGKQFHWCTKQHNNGKGKWLQHREEDHDEADFNRSKAQGNANRKRKPEPVGLTMDADLSTALTVLHDAAQDFSKAGG